MLRPGRLGSATMSVSPSASLARSSSMRPSVAFLAEEISTTMVYPLE